MGLPAAALLAKVTAKSAHDDLLGALDGLKQGFVARKAEVEAQEAASVTAFSGAMDSKRTEHDTDAASLATKKGLLETAESDIAQATTDIEDTSQTLADDKKYLKELSRECEAKAKEWDQEATMRKNELEALAKALEILQGDAATTADTAGEAVALAQEPEEPAKAGLMQLPAGAETLEDF